MSRILLAAFTCLVPATTRGQNRAAPLPKLFVSQAAGADLLTPRTVSIVLNSRRVNDAVSPVKASKLVGQMIRAMRKSSLRPISDATAAELSLEMVVESHEHWGADRTHDDPYIFLLLRNRASQHLLYCGYKRVGFSYHSAADDLLDDLSRRSVKSGMASTGDIAGCEAEAKRPVDLELSSAIRGPE